MEEWSVMASLREHWEPLTCFKKGNDMVNFIMERLGINKEKPLEMGNMKIEQVRLL